MAFMSRRSRFLLALSPVFQRLGWQTRRDMVVGDILQNDPARANNSMLTNSDSVRNHNVRTQPAAVPDGDPPHGPPLVRHRDIGSVVDMVSSDTIDVGGKQHVFAHPNIAG